MTADFTLALEHELSLAPPCPQDISSSEWNKELVTISLSGLTAYQAVFIESGLASAAPSLDVVPTISDIRLLLTDAPGSVGHARYAVCSVQSLDLVRSFHAAATIDITPPSFTSLAKNIQKQSLKKCHLEIDTVGGALAREILLDPSSILEPGGRIISIAAPMSSIATSPLEVSKFEKLHPFSLLNRTGGNWNTSASLLARAD
ncbi:uncharacterized protein EV422DRAFT_232118 [Fimicolochytrium jonesii]|uniref:uncharacterized protein n=1 Tax=Fimicolochytrium jonesii TaxID=1396493 RepID=UPI0022FDD84B|nr:uncharacterized protein EV422DRAFT_232118 [Fimicolochytrium jonesii]KAI8817318.1 hypothetical protein EV422DRAFT_232118 [Fimicolochytrium jonesii]